MKRSLWATVLFSFLIFKLTGQLCIAEDINEIFKKVTTLASQKNYPKAMEEIEWARKEIEKLHVAQIRTFFPDELAGFTGQKLETNSVLGMTAIERNYSKENSNVKVSLAGGSSGSAGAGLGNLAALGRMAAMMEGQGQETFRISGRTASMTVNEEAKNAELTVFLDSGSILKFEMGNGNAETLKVMAEAMKVNDLDNYLKGASSSS